MFKKIPKTQSWLLLILAMALVISGCGGGGGGSEGSSTYTVSGTVVDQNDVPLKDVIVTFSGSFGAATTNSDGQWSKSGLTGTVTATPALEGFNFDPSSVEITGARSDVNFTGTVATDPYEVSGTVVDGEGNPLQDVTITFSGSYGTTTTNENGQWSKSDLLGSVTVTPSLDGYVFEPVSTVVTEAKSDVDFTGRAVYTVSGTVFDDEGTPLSGVTITFSGSFGNVTTNASGAWSKSGLTGTVTVTPSLDGYTFEPSSTEVTVSRSDVNFIGTPMTYDATGTITIEAPSGVTPLDLTTITLSYEYPAGTPQTVNPDAGGNWTIPDIVGSVTVTPSTTTLGWGFISSSFTLTSENATGYTFTVNRAYTGQQILDAINGNATITSMTAGTTMPNNLTIDGDTVPIASVVYLMSKWISLFSDGTSVDGTIPGEISYLEIAEPDTMSGSTLNYGRIHFVGGTDGYYGAAVSLAATLESTKKIPDEFAFSNAWEDAGDPKLTKTVNAGEAISTFARVINFVKTDGNGKLSGYGSCKGMIGPTDWQD